MDPLEPYLKKKVASKSNRIFQPKENVPEAEVTIFEQLKNVDGESRLQTRSSENIYNPQQGQYAIPDEIDNCTCVYTIKSATTWSALNISRELFDQLIIKYRIFQDIWLSMFAFISRHSENEYAFPVFRSRRSSSRLSKIHELTYVIRRVDYNGGRKNFGPWSIRQTGVYHKLTYPSNKSNIASNSVFVLVTPSKSAEAMIRSHPSQLDCDDHIIDPSFFIHERIIADSLKGWVDYMTSLEEDINEQFSPMVTADLDSGIPWNEESFPSNQQRIKHMESTVSNLIVILQNKIHTIRSIGKICRQHKQMSCGSDSSCACNDMVDLFEQYAVEGNIYYERAKLLQARVTSIQRFLTDLLTHEGGQKMEKLTNQSIREARVVRVLTLVGLITLPITIVENFFSTQLVWVDDEGSLRISGHVWKMIVAAVVLVVIALIVWGGWVMARGNSYENLSRAPKLRSKDRDIEMEEGHRETATQPRGFSVLKLHFPNLTHSLSQLIKKGRDGGNSDATQRACEKKRSRFFSTKPD